jgi:hypothetical protein
MQCIVCGKELTIVQKFSEDPAYSSWAGGTVEWVYCGYGSRYDGEKFLVGLCDDCLAAKREPLPRTADDKPVYPGMPLFRKGLDDRTLQCQVDVRATWIDLAGHTFVDSVENYYSEPQQ